MAEKIDLTPDQDAALERAWQKIGPKLATIPPSKFDDGPALDEPDSGDGRERCVLKGREHLVAPRLLHEQLHQGARVQVGPQRRSSAT